MPKSDDCVKAYFTHISPIFHPNRSSAEDGNLSLDEANAHCIRSHRSEQTHLMHTEGSFRPAVSLPPQHKTTAEVYRKILSASGVTLNLRLK